MSSTSTSLTGESILNTARKRHVPAMAIWPRLRRSGAFTLALTAALIVAADLLFYGHPIGWTIALFGGALLAAVLLRSHRFLLTWPGRIIFAAQIVLLLLLVEHPSALRITLAIAGLLSLVILNRHGWSSSVPAWWARWAELLGRMCCQPALDLAGGVRWRLRHKAPNARALRTTHWLIATALSAIFLLLFAAANPIIANWLERWFTGMWDFLTNLTKHVPFGRALLWLLTGLVVWTVLRGCLRWASHRLESLIFSAGAIERSPGALSLITRCLILFNIVFAVQLGLDLVTMLSSGANLPEGMTYSEYARRGAYPLVATALLAALFVLIAFPTGASAAATVAIRWPRRLVYVWIAQNILLTASAVWRLSMYVEAFGLTRLRLAAAIWMLLVIAGLCWIIWRLAAHRTNAWLLRVNFVTLLVVLYACCFLSFGSIIAWYRLDKTMEFTGSGPRIDLAYMRSLGIDALPALEWVAAEAPDDAARQKAATHVIQLRQQLRHDLRSWHGWTWRRQRILSE